MRALLLILGVLAFAVAAGLRASDGGASPPRDLLLVWSYLAMVRGLSLDRWLWHSLRLGVAELRANRRGAEAPAAPGADAR